METIVNIKVTNIYPHPDNPRKDVGDVTELAESIKKSGIMQNLTVIPLSALSEEPDKQPEADKISLNSDFRVLIGHRRLAASKMAGLTEVPCKIVSKISKKEQVGIMLEENMQRADLTIWEQAQGFQMMLDLGETEDSIAEKTGFSKTTVRHRINIAKLNQDELKKKEQSDSFQLTLKDLYALEQVEDIETRNKILKEATDSRQLIWRAQSAAEDEARKKRGVKLVEILEKKGVKPAPKGADKELWSGKWDRIKYFSLYDKDFDVSEIKDDSEELYYTMYNQGVYLIKRIEQHETEQSTDNNESRKKQQELEENKNKLRTIQSEMSKRLSSFIEKIITGKIEPVKDEYEVVSKLWKLLAEVEAYIGVDCMMEFFADEDDNDNDEAIEAAVRELSMLNQMILILYSEMTSNHSVFNYHGKYNESNAKFLLECYEVFERYGWTFENDEEQLLDGTHELYVKE